jgi:hypothetical protein
VKEKRQKVGTTESLRGRKNKRNEIRRKRKKVNLDNLQKLRD